jgi:hypothetical protein
VSDLLKSFVHLALWEKNIESRWSLQRETRGGGLPYGLPS